MKSNFYEIFWSVFPALLFAVLVAVLIMAVPSVDEIVWGEMTCFCEFDAPEFPQIETEHTTRKFHICSECGSTIEPGEKYTRIFGVWDRVVSVFKQCEFCRKIWNILIYECDLDCLCFGEMLIYPC